MSATPSAGRLLGRVVVVTGSSRSLGLAIGRAALVEGARVVVSSRSAEAVARAVAALEWQGHGDRVAGQACDVADAAAVASLGAHALECFGRLDVWVNNAGLSAPYGPTLAVSPDLFEAVVRTNVLGTYHGSRVALGHFLGTGHGKLINVLGRGDRGPVPLQNAYAASKAWVRSFTLALAAEYRKEPSAAGIGIFALNPGLMPTDLLQRPSVIAGYEARLAPLPTIVRLFGTTPEASAQRAVWLASGATDGRTGQEVRLGGRATLLRNLAYEAAGHLRGHAPPPMPLRPVVVPPATAPGGPPLR